MWLETLFPYFVATKNSCCLHVITNCCYCGRVLEQSYMAEDTKPGTKRKHADLWFVDPLNPHERKRLGRLPVGLKNVGNTCWFSAVIQVCFQDAINCATFFFVYSINED